MSSSSPTAADVNAAVMATLTMRGIRSTRFEEKAQVFASSEGVVGLPLDVEEKSIVSTRTVQLRYGVLTIRHYDTPAYTHQATGQAVEPKRQFTMEILAKRLLCEKIEQPIRANLHDFGLAHLRVFSDPSTIRIYVEEKDWEYMSSALGILLTCALDGMEAFRKRLTSW